MATTMVSGSIPMSNAKKQKFFNLFEAYPSASGTAKLVLLVQLRGLVAATNPFEMLDLINNINQRWQLDLLLGAGMRGVCYYGVVAREAELMGLG
jgi:hypothetical protein